MTFKLSETSDGCSIMALDDITIDEASVLRIQGYRDLQTIRPAIKRAAAAAAREMEAIAVPRVYFRMFDIQLHDGKLLELEDGTTFENEAFQRFLNGAQQVLVFILTMGHAVDESVIKSIANDQLLNALFIETAGWLGIESATRSFSIHLRKFARARAQRLSPRLGPGYSYKLDGRSVLWPLEQQQTLFRLFADDPIDVRILESCAMLPKISRSGIYGLLPAR